MLDLAGLISLFGGLCYAELGTAMPKAGGRLVYLDEAFHPVVGFMAGFTDWLIGGPGSIAAVSIALMTVFQPYFRAQRFWSKGGGYRSHRSGDLIQPCRGKSCFYHSELIYGRQVGACHDNTLCCYLCRPRQP